MQMSVFILPTGFLVATLKRGLASFKTMRSFKQGWFLQTSVAVVGRLSNAREK